MAPLCACKCSAAPEGGERFLWNGGYKTRIVPGDSPAMMGGQSMAAIID